MCLSISTRHTHTHTPLSLFSFLQSDSIPVQGKCILEATAHAHFAPHRSHVPDTDHSAYIVRKYNGQMERHILHINPS